MDILNQLLQGFATAGTPINLLWALLGCTIGTAVGVLPGIGPATAVAMLLPITLKVDPTASMIFFAGIYYGAMYGGSTTSILLNTPGESGSWSRPWKANRMAKHGRAGAGAGRRRSALRRRHDRHRGGDLLRAAGGRLRRQTRPPGILPADGAGLLHGVGGAGKATLRGLMALFVPAWRWGWSASTRSPARARYTGGVPELMDGLEVVLIAVGLFAVAEALYAVLYEGRVEESQNRMSKVHMTAAEWPLLAGPAARHLHRRARSAASRPAAARSRPSSATPPSASSPCTPRSSAPRARSKAWLARSGNNAAITATLIPLLTLGIPTSKYHRDPARRVPELRHQTGPAAVRQERCAGVGADRQRCTSAT